ncbi:MAG: MFS transporter [Dehalococcoidia bacterium]|nr:MFS transporter [Dehalococcoidia bacterium]
MSEPSRGNALSRRIAFLRENEHLVAISLSTVLVMAGQGVIAPVLPLFAREFGVGTAVIGLTLAVFGLARLILNVPLGALSDRYGRRVLLVGGPIVTAVGMVGSGFAPTIETLLVWRFVAGAGSSMYMTGAMVYLTDISTSETRARFIGTNQGALLIGTAIGPAVGGIVAEYWGLRAPFHVVGVAALFAAVYAWARLPETRSLGAQTAPATQRSTGDRSDWMAMVLSRDFFAVGFVTLVIFLTRTGSRQTLVPLLGEDALGLSPGDLGAIFTAMSVINVILLTPAALAADRFGRKRVIVPSMLAHAVGLLMYASADNVTMFLLASLALSVAASMAGPAPAAYAADLAPPSVRGLAMGLYRTTGDIGFMVGPPLLGAMADATSFAWGLTANAVLAAASAVAFLVLAREAGQQRQPRAAEVSTAARS